jgi:phosphomannomutase/phosphoglucomutase
MLVESFSGIRGIFDETLTEEVAEKYAYCYACFLMKKYKKNTIVIGTDTRPSSEILKNVLIEALNTDVIDVGVAPTPAVEFAVRHFKAEGGIIITASHNEPYWNGFKFLDKDGSILREKDMSKIIEDYHKVRDMPLEDFLAKRYKCKKGKIKIKKIMRKHEELIRAYSEFILKFVKKDLGKIKRAKIKLVLDPNGGAGIIAKDILENAGVKVIGVNMDYSIFNRRVEPDEDSLFYLGNIIREEKADFGAGFDCDADRLQIMLPNNKLVSGHYLLALIANELFKEGKKKLIVVSDSTSGVVKEVAKKHRAKLVEVEVGETNVVEGMKKHKAAIGGEGSSGGVIIAPSKCRDGILTLLMAIKIIASKKAKLNTIISHYPAYYTSTKKLEFKMEKHDKIKKGIENYYLRKNKKLIKKGGATGSLKVLIDDNSFVWFRASKTESNVFRIMADSPSRQKTERLLKEAVEVFSKAK